MRNVAPPRYPQPVTHKKTGNAYILLGIQADCTNTREGNQVALYVRADTPNALPYPRDLVEFWEKFEPAGAGAAPVRRVFIDMDGVIVDFDGYCQRVGLPPAAVKHLPGAYRAMAPIPGALEAVRELIALGYEVWIATKPPKGGTHAYTEKAEWVAEHLPELAHRVIVTHDKGLLGSREDFLCDDRPHKANCESFVGTLLRFVDGYHWQQALQHLRASARKAA